MGPGLLTFPHTEHETLRELTVANLASSTLHPPTVVAVEVVCPIDGVVFEAESPNATYCSSRCRMRASRQRRGKVVPPHEPRQCVGVDCEVWFTPSRSDQLYHSAECRRAGYWDRERK